MKILADIGFAFLIVFCIWVVLILTKDFSLMAIPKSIFFFLLSSAFPFIAATYEAKEWIYICLFILAFSLVFMYVPLTYRKYGLTVVLAGWEFYGLGLLAVAY